MDFDAYLQSKGYSPGEKIPRTTANQLHSAWLKEGGKSSFQPAIVNVPVPGSTNTVPAFMSSANSATLMKDVAPKVTYKPDADGNLYAIEGTTAAVVTNTQGQPIKVDPKSSRLEDLMNLMGQGGAEPEQGPNFIDRIFGRVAASPTPTPAPSPTPEATPMPSPMPSPTPGTAPLQGQTNAPAAMPTPAVISAADYKQMTGQDLPPGDYADANGRPFSIR
jgi:hypothetical protein